jgi:hypothetical protein
MRACNLKESLHARSSTVPAGGRGLLTAAFVRKATAYSRTAGEPLVLRSARRPEETLRVYSQDWVEPPYGKWRVSLGPNQPFAPPPPTWREHLLSAGYRLDTPDDLERVYFEKGLAPADLDKPLDGFGWEDMWDNSQVRRRRRIIC